jgi:hypothetical protein
MIFEIGKHDGIKPTIEIPSDSFSDVYLGWLAGPVGLGDRIWPPTIGNYHRSLQSTAAEAQPARR